MMVYSTSMSLLQQLQLGIFRKSFPKIRQYF